jgi:hypothetical protein
LAVRKRYLDVPRLGLVDEGDLTAGCLDEVSV